MNEWRDLRRAHSNAYRTSPHGANERQNADLQFETQFGCSRFFQTVKYGDRRKLFGRGWPNMANGLLIASAKTNVVAPSIEKAQPIGPTRVRRIFVLNDIIFPKADGTDLIAAWPRVGQRPEATAAARV
jgi:hypothetical protein